MYIRTVQRKNKDGSVVRYLQLAHNVRHPQTRRPRAQVLWSFGREEEVDRQQLERLVRSITRFLSPEQALQAQATEGMPLRFVGSRPLGGGWVLHGLWRKLGLDQVIRKVVTARGLRAPVERALFAMVANRALAPRSKLGTQEWLDEAVALPGVEGVELQHLYRAMDVLVEAGAELEREVYWALADLLSLEVDLLFLDTTTSYFEIEGEDLESPEDAAYVLRRRSQHSTDHRPDRAQIVIGLAVTRTGLPVRCWVWPGNTTDVTRVQQVKRDLVDWKLGRVVTVVDRGFVSEENLRTLQQAGGHYIAGEKLRSGKPAVEAALTRQGRYQKVQPNVEVKEILVGAGEARLRYVLVRNPAQAARDRERREDILRAVREQLAGLERLPKAEHTRAVCSLVAHPAYGRYLRLDRRNWPVLDRSKLNAEARLDGKYLLRTSDDTLSAADVALGYKQLIEVEEAFRTLKHTLDIRPVYHRLSRRIKAHVLLCWLALLLVRLAELWAEENLGQRHTWARLRRELDRMQIGHFLSPKGTVHQRTETSTFQAVLFKALGLEEPPRFFKIAPRQHL
jgi:transposase